MWAPGGRRFAHRIESRRSLGRLRRPLDTSIPASRSARAMIFAPRSWPSRPGFAITTLIFRAIPSASIWRCVSMSSARRPPGRTPAGPARVTSSTAGSCSTAARACWPSSASARPGRPSRRSRSRTSTSTRRRPTAGWWGRGGGAGRGHHRALVAARRSRPTTSATRSPCMSTPPAPSSGGGLPITPIPRTIGRLRLHHRRRADARPLRRQRPVSALVELAQTPPLPLRGDSPRRALLDAPPRVRRRRRGSRCQPLVLIHRPAGCAPEVQV